MACNNFKITQLHTCTFTYHMMVLMYRGTVYVIQLINKCNNMMKINTCIVQTKCNITKSSPLYEIMNELSLPLYSLLSLHTYQEATNKQYSIVYHSQARHLLCTFDTGDLSF